MRKCFLAVLLSVLLISGVRAVDSSYILCIRDDLVCYYDCHHTCWIYTDTPSDALTSEDQALLKEGLCLATKQDLTKALEDFCS